MAFKISTDIPLFKRHRKVLFLYGATQVFTQRLFAESIKILESRALSIKVLGKQNARGCTACCKLGAQCTDIWWPNDTFILQYSVTQRHAPLLLLSFFIYFFLLPCSHISSIFSSQCHPTRSRQKDRRCRLLPSLLAILLLLILWS